MRFIIINGTKVRDGDLVEMQVTVPVFFGQGSRVIKVTSAFLGVGEGNSEEVNLFFVDKARDCLYISFFISQIKSIQVVEEAKDAVLRNTGGDFGHGSAVCYESEGYFVNCGY